MKKLLDVETSEEELMNVRGNASTRERGDRAGILVQLPLPESLSLRRESLRPYQWIRMWMDFIRTTWDN